MIALNRVIPFIFGLTMSLNFALIWALPIMGMGGLWKSVIKQFLLPIILFLDESPSLRNFAKKYVYTKPEHADFFLTSLLVTVNSIISLSTVFYWQLSTGSLPYWLILAYYCSWVGIGGRTMGGAYALAHKEKTKYDKLYQGVVTYWLMAVGILVITRSFTFVFWIYLQPLMCMTYFLALLNYGFHGFLEFDEQGKSIPCVDSTTIIDGDDDCFGEDDHMAHHYNPSVYYKDLASLQESKVAEFIKHKASVFRGLSIVELSIFLLFSLWDKLADHYVDYSGKMTREEIKSLLKARAQRRQTTYEKYEHFIQNPTPEAREALFPEMKRSKPAFQHGPVSLTSQSLEKASPPSDSKAYLSDSTDSLTETISSTASDSGSENSAAHSTRLKSD